MNLATLFLLADTPAPKPVDTGLQGMNMLAMMVFAFAIMYIVSIRPQAKKQKELLARMSLLKTGDRVVTSGGIYGTVANVKDGSTLILKIADNVKIEIDKTAIANVVNPETGKPESAPALAKA